MTCSLRLPVPPPVTPLHPPARPVTENVAPAERIAAEEPGMTATDQVRDATLTKKTSMLLVSSLLRTYVASSDNSAGFK